MTSELVYDVQLLNNPGGSQFEPIASSESSSFFDPGNSTFDFRQCWNSAANWVTKNNLYTVGSGVYVGSATRGKTQTSTTNDGIIEGEWGGLQFKDKVRVTRMTFITGTQAGSDARDVKLVGSNDGIVWTMVYTGQNNGGATFDSGTFTNIVLPGYKYYRIIVLSTQLTATSGFCNMDTFRLYYDESPQITQTLTGALEINSFVQDTKPDCFAQINRKEAGGAVITGLNQSIPITTSTHFNMIDTATGTMRTQIIQPGYYKLTVCLDSTPDDDGTYVWTIYIDEEEVLGNGRAFRWETTKMKDRRSLITATYIDVKRQGGTSYEVKCTTPGGKNMTVFDGQFIVERMRETS
jgi:hypothetical protein